MVGRPDFAPNVTPEEMIRGGMFGGVYFRRKDLFDPAELPPEWFAGLDPAFYDSPTRKPLNNKYRVNSGTFQSDWERAGWIREQDPRGWVQWYFRYYLGRRSPDDDRQIERWMRFASVERGRWTNIFYGKVWKSGRDVTDLRISPVIRQSLFHWAYEPNACDYETWRLDHYGE